MIFKSSNHPFHSKLRFQHESFKRKKLSISFKFSFNFNFIVSLFYIVLFSQNVFLVRIIVCSRKPENVFLVMPRKKVLAYFRILEMKKRGGGGGGGAKILSHFSLCFCFVPFFFFVCFFWGGHSRNTVVITNQNTKQSPAGLLKSIISKTF